MGLLDRMRNTGARAINWFIGGNSSMSTNYDLQKAVNPQQVALIARSYYDGEQMVKLTDRQKEYLARHGRNTNFNVNICSTVIDMYMERLHHEGYDVTGDSEAEADKASLMLQTYKMDAPTLKEAMRNAMRDGMSFVVVDYRFPGRIQYSINELLIPEEYGGEGVGMYPVWVDDEDYPESFVKIWKFEEGDEVVMRKNIYHTGFIEKFIKIIGTDVDWRPYEPVTIAQTETDIPPDGIGGIYSWADADGKLLPPPVIMFSTLNNTSILKSVIPFQDMENKVWVDIMAAMDEGGFRQKIYMGFIPTTDGKALASDKSNLLRVLPGESFATTTNPADGKVIVIDPADPESLLKVEERIMHRLSTVTGIPESAFTATRQVAAEGTLKQQESRLIARVEDFQEVFEASFKRLAEQVLAQLVAFGEDPEAPSTWEGYTIDVIWGAVPVRNEKEELGIVETKSKLGIPLNQLMIEMGYTDDKINEMMKTPEAQAVIAKALATIAAAQIASGSANG